MNAKAIQCMRNCSHTDDLHACGPCIAAALDAARGDAISECEKLVASACTASDKCDCWAHRVARQIRALARENEGGGVESKPFNFRTGP